MKRRFIASGVSGGRRIRRRARTAAALALLTFANAADAGCLTSSFGCSGRTTFRNRTNNVQCVSIFWAYGGNRNFCLNPGDVEEVAVRSGDSYCYVDGNYAPPSNCTRYVLQTD